MNTSESEIITHDDIKNVLNLMRKFTGNNVPLMGASSTHEQVIDFLEHSPSFKASPLRIAPETKKIFDTLDIIFNELNTYSEFNKKTADLVCELKLPVLKMMLVDNQFLINRVHPARLFINLFVTFLAGVTDTIPYTKNSHLQKLESVLADIKKHDDVDSEVFAEAYNQLRYYITELDYQANVNTRSSREPVEALCDAEISRRLKKVSVPKPVKLLLEQVWKNIMIDTYYDKFGDEKWSKAVKFIEAIVWSSQEGKSNVEKKTLMKIIPGLTKSLKTGLEKMAYPEEDQNVIMQDMSSLHLHILGKKTDYSGQSINENAYKNYEELIVYRKARQQLALQHPAGATLDKQMIADEVKKQLVKHQMSYASQVSFLESTNEQQGRLENKYQGVDFELISIINRSINAAAKEDDYCRPINNYKVHQWLEFNLSGGKIRAMITWLHDKYQSLVCLTQNGRVIQISREGLADLLRKNIVRHIDQLNVFEDIIKSNNLDNITP